MKLRNKKTGQEGNFIINKDHFECVDLEYVPEYRSLAELNEEWEDAPDEEWRDVLGFEELYQVSNLGNVRTVKRGEATAMAQEEQRNGYLSVHLRNKGIERRASVHRLVAEAFIPNPDGLRDVNHKNGIKTDNRLENLEWMSHSDNMKHQYQVLKTGRYGHLYKPAEPLVRGERSDEVRTAIRAFGAAIQEKKHILVIKQCGLGMAEFSNGSRFWIRLPLNNETMDALEDRTYYTIDELCGKEEK